MQTFCQVNREDAKGQILYDSTHTRYLEQSFTADQQLRGGPVDEELLLNGKRISVWGNRNFWKQWSWLLNNVNAINATELHI